MKKILVFIILLCVAVFSYSSSQFAIGESINSIRQKRNHINSQQGMSMAQLKQIQYYNSEPSNDTIKLNFYGFNKFGFDSKYNDWYMEIVGTDASKPEYGFRVIFAYYAPSDSFCGTFTSENRQINMADSYIYNPKKGYVELESATLTIEHRIVSANLQQYIATAVALGKDGVTYHISCIHNNITPKEQISTEIPNAQLIREDTTFKFIGRNSNFRVTFLVNSSELLGKYSMNAINLTGSEFVHNGTKLQILSIQAEVKTEILEEDLACVADIAFLTYDTVLYTIKMVYALPTPIATRNVVCTDLDVDGSLAEYIGVVNFEASNANYVVSGTWIAEEATVGTYSHPEVAIELFDKAYNTDVLSLDATLNVAIDTVGRWMITGYVRGDNNVLYNLDLSYVIPVPTDTVVVRFSTPSQASFNPEFNNDLVFENKNDEYYASINVVGVEMGEYFNIKNVNREYCGVRDSITGISSKLADINGRIFQVGDTTIMQAELISMDATLYDVELWYVAPTPVDTINLMFPVDFGDLRSEQGFYQLYGPSPDTTYVVAFSPISEEIEGTFVNDGMFGRFGKKDGRYEMAARYTYVAVSVGDEAGNRQFKLLSIEKGEMTVEMNDKGEITAKASVVCSDHVLYNITMTSKYVKVYLEGDAKNNPVERTYTSEDELRIEDYSQYGYIYLAIAAKDMSDLTAMHFFVESVDPDILIPEGNYVINKSYRPNTVLANLGLDEKGEVQTPIYATCNAQGYLTNVYMWVSGTVEVTKKEGEIHLEINALNSYDVPVHIVYDASLTNVENLYIDACVARKHLVNGQLVIMKDGVLYNANGMLIKMNNN